MHTRIAPTPSGYLHAGNACSFLLTKQLANRHGGTVRLRIDDIDAERTRPEYLTDIFETLHYLEIDYDYGPSSVQDFQSNYSQLLRLPLYEALLNDLSKTGFMYACLCSRRMLAEKKGYCDCRQKRIAANTEGATWRVHVPTGTVIRFTDEKLGEQIIDLAQVMPHPVVRKRDGLPAYQVVSLADDLYYSTDYIVRGADLLPSTAIQLYLAQLTGRHSFLKTSFFHHPLLKNHKGSKLSKSAGDAAVTSSQSGFSLKELQQIADSWV